MLTTFSPRLYLAIDAGGAHTEAIICNESGFTLGRSLLQYGANMHNVPPAHVYQILLKAADAARENMRFTNPNHAMLDAPFNVVCVGLSGYDTATDATKILTFIQQLDHASPVFTSDKLIFMSSGMSAFKAGTEKSFGVSITIGTGTHCYGVARDGSEASVGGWGHLLGDQGSGYWIGRALLRQVMREYDGRARKTPITDKVLEALRFESPAQLIDWAYTAPRIPVPEIARLSVLANDPALQYLHELNTIINESVRDVADSYSAIVRRLKLGDVQQLPVVIGGGILGMQGNYAERVSAAIRTITPLAEIIRPTVTPAHGAIRFIQESEKGDVMPRSALIVVNPKPEASGAPEEQHD